MSTLIDYWDKKFYPGYAKNWDDDFFRKKILENVSPDMHMLDLGAGAGIVEQMNFKGVVARVCGVDLDPRVINNPYLDEGRMTDAANIPWPENSFDLVFSDNVLEHLADPSEVFKEVIRVLKPDGVFLFKTPNKFHYMPTIARMTPHWFHQFINKLRGRAEIDTFHTLYRANTKKEVIKLAQQVGFKSTNVLRVEGRPEYLRMSILTYVFGTIYERLVNSNELLSPFRVVLIGQLKK